MNLTVPRDYQPKLSTREIGQSLLCMFFLRTAHIGEVAVGLWPPAMEAACANAGIFLL